jgi:DNA-binding NarL/FixJ family response regulator
MNKTKILLADDQILFVESLKTVIDALANDMAVIGIVHDGKEAVAFTKAHRPDMVLMDVRMPNIDGVEATKIIHEEFPTIKIIMLTNFDEDEYVQQAMKLGAVGYLLKDMVPEELLSSLRAVRNGSVLISPSITNKLFNRQQEPQWLKKLSDKEREILVLVSKGYRNREIAEKVYLGEQTVKNYISSIYNKMGIDSRFKAVRMAIEVKLDRSV